MLTLKERVGSAVSTGLPQPVLLISPVSRPPRASRIGSDQIESPRSLPPTQASPLQDSNLLSVSLLTWRPSFCSSCVARRCIYEYQHP